jgi:hypothetical protein
MLILVRVDSECPPSNLSQLDQMGHHLMSRTNHQNDQKLTFSKSAAAVTLLSLPMPMPLILMILMPMSALTYHS